MRKKVLVTNDDSVHSKSLKALVEQLHHYEVDIMVVAPSSEKSAVSHSITIRHGLKLHELEDIIPGVKTYSIDGTPADCVKVAKIALNYDFDLVFSGVNDGLNMADDVMYSGTVAGAAEAVMMGAVGIAISVAKNSLEAISEGFVMTMDFMQKNHMLHSNQFYNINIPRNPKGIKITHQTKNATETKFKLVDGLHYMIGEPDRKTKLKDLTGDIMTYLDGYISITPLTNDRTNYKKIKELLAKK
jgi:5'-nucleotidase